jgi:hypothetical protein
MLLSDNLIELSMKEIQTLKEFAFATKSSALLEEENINKSQIIDTNRIFCDLCLHDYRIDNYKKHLKSKKHLKKLLKI